MSEIKNSFEKNIKQLEEIITKLESGNYTLEQSLELFESGMKYAADCRSSLDAAEKKIIQLSAVENEEENSDN